MFKALFKPMIRDRNDLWRYVFTVIGVCIGIAMSIDVTNQLMFFEDWPTAIRSWCITILEAGGLSLPISLGIGRTNLELYEAKQLAEQASRVDHLTGLLNRRALLEAVARLEEVTLALVIADIDFFKRVNDTYGHLIGDMVIATVAKLMEQELAGLGTLARIGGEEFALLVGQISPDEIAERLEDTRRRIAEMPVMAEGRAVSVTISMGLATGLPGESFEQLFAKADRALYVAKAGGRNRVVRFDQIEHLRRRVPLDELRDSPRAAKSA